MGSLGAWGAGGRSVCVHPKGGDGGDEEPRNGLKRTEPSALLFPRVSSTTQGHRARGTHLTHIATCSRPERTEAAERNQAGTRKGQKTGHREGGSRGPVSSQPGGWRGQGKERGRVHEKGPPANPRTKARQLTCPLEKTNTRAAPAAVNPQVKKVPSRAWDTGLWPWSMLDTAVCRRAERLSARGPSPGHARAKGPAHPGSPAKAGRLHPS